MSCAVLLVSLNPLVALVANHKFTTARGTVYGYGPDPALDFLRAHVAPGDPLFVYPYSPMYYFLSGARNPTRYFTLTYSLSSDEQFREAVRDIEAARVRYVVWDRSHQGQQRTMLPAFRMPPRDKLIIEPYLTEHYRVMPGSDDKYQFLERKESIPSSAVLAGGR
jgi:hypothetical protein